METFFLKDILKTDTVMKYLNIITYHKFYILTYIGDFHEIKI